jgi:hypothetical protein
LRDGFADILANFLTALLRIASDLITSVAQEPGQMVGEIA